MRKVFIKFLLIVTMLSTVTLKANFLEDVKIYPSLVQLAEKPDLFFQSFQYQLDNYNPIFGKKYMPLEWRAIVDRKADDIFKHAWSKRFSVSIDISAIMLSILNYNLKATVFREGVYIPEIYLGFGHFFYLPMYAPLFKNDYGELLKKMKLQSFSGFIGFAKSLKTSFKLFTGYRFSYGILNIDYPQSIFDQYQSLIKVKEFEKKWFLHDIFVGMTFLIPDSNWESLISVGFNPELVRFNAKLEFLYKYVGLGLVLFPDNILTFRPFVRVLVDF